MTREQFVMILSCIKKNYRVNAQIVIYSRPHEFPEGYIARVHYITNKVHTPSSTAFFRSESLTDLQSLLDKDFILTDIPSRQTFSNAIEFYKLRK